MNTDKVIFYAKAPFVLVANVAVGAGRGVRDAWLAWKRWLKHG